MNPKDCSATAEEAQLVSSFFSCKGVLIDPTGGKVTCDLASPALPISEMTLFLAGESSAGG
jgi:hypothetical protein